MGFFANLLYGLAGTIGLLGLLLIWVPILGLLLLALAAALYFAAGYLRREARRQGVLRQQGGSWLD